MVLKDGDMLHDVDISKKLKRNLDDEINGKNMYFEYVPDIGNDSTDTGTGLKSESNPLVFGIQVNQVLEVSPLVVARNVKRPLTAQITQNPCCPIQTQNSAKLNFSSNEIGIGLNIIVEGRNSVSQLSRNRARPSKIKMEVRSAKKTQCLKERYQIVNESGLFAHRYKYALSYNKWLPRLFTTLLALLSMTFGVAETSTTPSLPSNVPSSPPSSLPSKVPLSPSPSPSKFPSSTPSSSPSKDPSSSPSKFPSSVPSFSPSKDPSSSPSKFPSSVPSFSPSKDPSSSPSKFPSSSPSKLPSSSPSSSPSKFPTSTPSSSPSKSPSFSPSSSPSNYPSSSPSSTSPSTTMSPSSLPSEVPSSSPSEFPTPTPSSSPSNYPSSSPSSSPSKHPSSSPSSSPSDDPSSSPSSSPSNDPSLSPSSSPSKSPSSSPSPSTTMSPSSSPSEVPSSSPSEVPSSSPSSPPSKPPSSLPSSSPSNDPSLSPSSSPSNDPSSLPSSPPSVIPSSTSPSISPSSSSSEYLPSSPPSLKPSFSPTPVPTDGPSSSPSMSPTINRSGKPTSSTLEPSQNPSTPPSSMPSISPSHEPTYESLSEATRNFRQTLRTEIELNSTVILIFEKVMENYTLSFGPRAGKDDGRIQTKCTVLDPTPPSQRMLQSDLIVSEEKRLLEEANVDITFAMEYTSKYTDVTNYTSHFETFINENNRTVVNNLNEAGFTISSISKIQVLTNPPSLSPSAAPSNVPSLGPSNKPSSSPSNKPSSSPSNKPSSSPSNKPSPGPSNKPSSSPSNKPSPGPSNKPSPGPSNIPSPGPSNIPSPAHSNQPTNMPMITPTSGSTNRPSSLTTSGPSRQPSFEPSESPTEIPTSKPTLRSTQPPDVSSSSSSNMTLILVISGVSGAGIILLIIGYCIRKRNAAIKDRTGSHITVPQGVFTGKESKSAKDRKTKDLTLSQPKDRRNSRHGDVSVFHPKKNNPIGDDDDPFNNYAIAEQQVDDDFLMVPYQDSLVSNKSLISEGYSMSSESGTEDDHTRKLADEFDEYKDQNLEKMRYEVEGTVTNVDGMMSQALAKALMDDDDENRDVSELMWGGSGASMEIEASVLCEMNDWLKRREGATLDDKRSFMQETLNKMVASVRHGFIAPEEASRTIHGSAAMLGLQLAENIPETSLIVTGMRKMVTRKEMIEAFREFGEIEDAAVSPNARGFGLVRYKSPKSVQRAMERFRIGEIVVQDVAVMIKVLKSDSRVPQHGNGTHYPTEVELSHQYSNERRNRLPAAPATSRQSSRESNRSGGGMEGNQGTNMQPITYSENSFVRARAYGSRPRGNESDAGSSRSRTSSRSRSQSRQGT